MLELRNLRNISNDDINVYFIVNLYPLNQKSFRSCVYKTFSPSLNERFEFFIPFTHVLFQQLNFALWRFDRFSHHEIIAKTSLQLEEFEKYGLMISREISLAKILKIVKKAS